MAKFVLFAKLRFVLLLISISVLAACVVTPSLQDPHNAPDVGMDLQHQLITITAVGDMMFGGSSQGIMEEQGYDYPFATTHHILQAAHLTIGNLETPLTNQGAPITEKEF